MKKGKSWVKGILFLAIALALLVGATYVVRPIWTDWNMRNTTYGYYEEPKDTVETLFLGSSASTVGVIPMQLYEDYGICSYNAGTESQPLMASYYLAEEFYRRNGETLDTIVLEASKLRDVAPDSLYIKVLDSLKWSPVKIRFLWDFSEDLSDLLSHAIPLLSYHDRWEELTAEDFEKASYNLATYTRGYYFVTDSRLDRAENYAAIPLPNEILESEEVSSLDEEALTYFAKLADFCVSHEIQLTLIKTPQDDWTDEDHNATEALAGENGVAFYDFNYEPLLSEIDYNGAVDRMDENHMNYYGAVNLTDWLGKYLTEECGNQDVRGTASYAFLEEELIDYHRAILSTELEQTMDPAEYLSSLLAEDDYAVLISAKGEADAMLTEEQRRVFADLGLTKLSGLSSRTAYAAVIEDGRILEMTGTENEEPNDSEAGMDAVEATGAEEADETEEDAPVLSLGGKLTSGLSYAMTSGESDASIQIDGTEYSRWSDGLNFVVYDKKLEQVVDRAAFNTALSSERDRPVSEETLREVLETEGEDALDGDLLQLFWYDELRGKWTEDEG